ncbi:MAG: EAL domain-containing protein [Janthinobacterium lividum]
MRTGGALRPCAVLASRHPGRGLEVSGKAFYLGEHIPTNVYRAAAVSLPECCATNPFSSPETSLPPDPESVNLSDDGCPACTDGQRPVLKADLEAALSRSEFELYLQPIVRLADDRIKGFEALVRWQRPGCGLVMPADFVSVLEETGLIVPFGSWLVRKACWILLDWQSRLPAAEWLSLNVNLSARQFEDPLLFDTICGLVDEAGLEPSRLRLEVTESLMMRDPVHVAEVLRHFAALGFGVSLDDFGTGYSSLGYLQALPVDSLKIDRCFVTGLETEGGNLRIVRAIIGLAASLGLSVVAEGIENAEQAALLGRLGCSHGQGYYFARPLPVHEAEALLRNQHSHRTLPASSATHDPLPVEQKGSGLRPRWAGRVHDRLTLMMQASSRKTSDLPKAEQVDLPGSPDTPPVSALPGTSRTCEWAALGPLAAIPVLMTLHAGFVTALPALHDFVSSVCMAIGPAVAAMACWRAAFIADAELRLNWRFAALAFLFWTSGSLLSLWIPMDLSAGPVDFSYFLCSLALLLALTVSETDRPRALFLLLDGLQALLGAVLGYTVIFGAVPFSSQQLTPLSGASILSIYDVENVCMAALASLRFFGGNRSPSRHHFDRAMLLFTLTFGVMGSLYDHIAPPDASALDVMLDPAFLVVAGAAGLGMCGLSETDKLRAPLAAFVDSIGPVFFTAALLVVGAWIARQQVVAGITSILIAVAIYALRASLLHARCLVTQQDLQQAKDRLERLSLEDGLTGVGNRRAFDSALSTLWAEAKQTGEPLAVLYVDVDFFKKYNDRHGHPMGDKCLVRVAEVLRELARPQRGLVARYGGEEFAVLLPATSGQAALATALQARQAIASLDLVNRSGASAPVTVSIGFALSTQRHSEEAFLLEADDALYRAKHRGRDRVEGETIGTSDTEVMASVVMQATPNRIERGRH